MAGSRTEGAGAGPLDLARLPAIDGAAKVREVAFGLLLTEGRPIAENGLVALALGTSSGDVLDAMAEGGWIDRTADGLITGSAGLSLSNGPHRLRIAGRDFRTWCAYDAIGIPAALGVAAEIETECGMCGRTLGLAMAAGRPDRRGPELLWLAAGGDSLRTGFCTPTVLLCGEAHGLAWAERQGGRGELVGLHAAAEVGARDWASAADAARRLGRVEYVDGPWAGRDEVRLTLPDKLSVPGGRYARSVRCADDGAMRYVWHADGMA